MPDKMAGQQTTSPWFSTLFILTVFQVCAFVAVTVLQFCALNDVNDIDLNLDLRLQSLLSPQVRQKRETYNRRLSGVLEDLLLQQEKIIAQHCVHKDQPCQPGEKGDKGQQGDGGQKGETGDNGQKGEPGDSGLPGQKGEPGLPGIAGDKGEQGETGPIGPQGVKGSKGDPGLKGDQGIKGPQGPKGPKGEQGIPGIKGDPGLPGDKGADGDPGINGDKGSPGLKGETGPVGPPGKDINMLGEGCECLKKPKFTENQSSDVYILEGTTKEVPCVATGNPKPTVTVTRVTMRRGLTATNTSAGEKSYTFTNFINSDVGQYKCVATNSLGSAERVINVLRGELPVFITTPVDLSLASGTTVEINCAASGAPPPYITFWNDGHFVNTTLRYFVNGGHLTVRNTVPSDSGNYECRASNELGNVTSKPWKLQIY